MADILDLVGNTPLVELKKPNPNKAKVILTPKEQSMEGAIEYANMQVAKGGYQMLNQFGNEDNPLFHF